MRSRTGIAFVTALVVVATIVTGVTLATTPAAADGGDTLLGDVFEGDTSDKARDGASALWAGLGGARERAGWQMSNWVGSIFGDEDTQTSAEEADGLASYYNANNETLESWANARKNWTSNETLEISIHLDGETSTRYLVANASDGNITSSEMVETTSRTTTHKLTLCGYAAEQSTEELRHFNEEFAAADEDVDAAYVGRMKGKFSDDVETTLIDSSGDCEADS